MNISKTSQELKVLKALQENKGEWVNGQYFLRTLYLSQYHRAIWNLQNKRERYNYEGTIEASTFTDEYKFKSYRLLQFIPPLRGAIAATEPAQTTVDIVRNQQLDNVARTATPLFKI